MKQYKTIDIARRIGIHVNTVRLYEKCALIPKPERLPNGYRVFTDLHIEQFKLARAALRVEVLQNGLRKQAVNIIKVSAAGNYEEAAALTHRYIQQVDQERNNAEEAIQITRKILAGLDGGEHTGIYFTRKEAADLLGVTIDTLRKSSRPKSRNQIIKWLKNPHSDSAEYKMWGNGVALPNVYFVLSGIVYYSQFPEFLL